MFQLSSRIYFGICPASPIARNAGQMLKQVQHDKSMYRNRNRLPSLRVGFTMAARLSRFHNGLVGLRSAFTMAEILLSLTIIGVVAAITLPSLTGNINERTWNTQRKALYARMSQAIALMPALNGYGTLTEDESGSIEDTAAETFVTDGLAKVLKINNICDNEHLEDCGIASKFTTMYGSLITSVPTTLLDFNPALSVDYINPVNGNHHLFSPINTKAVAFETVNGESILTYYNKSCRASTNPAGWHFLQQSICANFIYDLNGSKGPNTVGKDIGFMTVLYAVDSSVVAPMPLLSAKGSSIKQNEAGNFCTAKDGESRTPNKDELSSMFYNSFLFLKDGFANGVWSSQTVSSDKAWLLYHDGGWEPTRKTEAGTVYCVKR